jgi:hypothetical protein
MNILLQLTLSVLFAVTPNPSPKRLNDYRAMLDDHSPKSWQVKGFDLPCGFFIFGRQLTAAGDFSYRLVTWDHSHDSEADDAECAEIRLAA